MTIPKRYSPEILQYYVNSRDTKPDGELTTMLENLSTTTFRKRLKEMYLNAVDGGFPGFNPLKLHTVVSGFPRGGTTLFQAMMSACVSDAKSFDDETAGFLTAAYTLRNHSYLISKRPNDIYWLDEIRDFYSNREANVNFILLLRDPRSVLASKHYASNNPHYVSIERWLNIYDAFQRQWEQSDALTLRYEDLILNTEQVQEKLVKFTNWNLRFDLSAYHLHLSSKFDDRAMHGVRPIDSASLEKWKDDLNRDRIRELLKQIPQFSEKLILMGYEDNNKWESNYE